MLLTTTLVLSAVAASGFSVSAQERALPVTPDPALCQIAPRPIADFEALVADESGPATAATPMATDTAAFTPPAGEPADAETIDAVTRSAMELFGCYAAGDSLRASSLWTDRYLAGVDAEYAYTEEDLEWLAATPIADVPEDRLTLQALREMIVLADGRVGSLLDVAYPDGSQETQYGIVTLVDGRYRLDEVLLAAPLAATPTP